MVIRVAEKSLKEVEERLQKIGTPLIQIQYLESVLSKSFLDLESKRVLWKKLADLYSSRKMFEKAAKALIKKASIEITQSQKADDYITSAEYYVKIGKIQDSEHLFFKALRDCPDKRQTIRLARKNIYSAYAKIFEREMKKTSAMKLYEQLLKTDLEEIEKKEVKKKLKQLYLSLGMFREARLID